MRERYDIFGDVHGCYDALRRLSLSLGYDEDFRHPDGRTPVFVGDLINRGPNSEQVLRLALKVIPTGLGLSVLGNHDEALLKYLRGEEVNLDDGGLRKTIASLEALPDAAELLEGVRRMYDMTPLCRALDGGKLLIVHAAIEDWILGRYKLPEEANRIGTDDPGIRHFVLHGDAIGKSPEGKTLRRDWASTYHGSAFVVYGHTPVDDAVIRHNTINIDTGAYRGGSLTAFRWPEREIVSAPSGYNHFAGRPAAQ